MWRPIGTEPDTDDWRLHLRYFDEKTKRTGKVVQY